MWWGQTEEHYTAIRNRGILRVKLVDFFLSVKILEGGAEASKK